MMLKTKVENELEDSSNNDYSCLTIMQLIFRKKKLLN